MKDDVDTVIGFLDIPPYVTIVPPCLKTRNKKTGKKKNSLYISKKIRLDLRAKLKTLNFLKK
jgi:hypothetical protein